MRDFLSSQYLAKLAKLSLKPLYSIKFFPTLSHPLKRNIFSTFLVPKCEKLKATDRASTTYMFEIGEHGCEVDGELDSNNEQSEIGDAEREPVGLRLVMFVFLLLDRERFLAGWASQISHEILYKSMAFSIL